MKNIVLVALFGLLTSSVVADERKVVLVETMEDAARAEAGTILRGQWHIGYKEHLLLTEIVANYCDLETFVSWDNQKLVMWVCEKA